MAAKRTDAPTRFGLVDDTNLYAAAAADLGKHVAHAYLARATPEQITALLRDLETPWIEGNDHDRH